MLWRKWTKWSAFRDAGKGEGDIEDLLLAQTAKERETQRLNEEIMELLNKPTNKVEMREFFP